MKEKFKNILVFSLIFIFLDQIIKIIISNKMVLNQSIVLIKKFFSIILVHNTGAAFSILTGSRLLLIFIGLIAIFLLCVYILKQKEIDDFDIYTYSLLLGGIVGNLIDRIVYGYVIDYLSFSFGNYNFPVFNFADICIVISVVLILFRMIREDLWK